MRRQEVHVRRQLLVLRHVDNLIMGACQQAHRRQAHRGKVGLSTRYKAGQATRCLQRVLDYAFGQGTRYIHTALNK